MRRTVFGVTLILLSMGIGSCGLIGGEDEPEVIKSADTTSEQSFPSASTKSPSSAPVAKVVLTRPTNPDERLRVVKSGRSDPFAAIVPRVFPNNSSPQSESSSESSNFREQESSPRINISSPKSGAPTQPSVSKSPKSSVSPGNPPNKIVLPELPKPEVAQGVKVTGVVNLGNQPRAILKAPGEKTTRTVSAGEYIANGQVLVKSIVLSNPAAPIVVLEQSGMEVRVGVGQEPVALAAATDTGKQ